MDRKPVNEVPFLKYVVLDVVRRSADGLRTMSEICVRIRTRRHRDSILAAIQELLDEGRLVKRDGVFALPKERIMTSSIVVDR